MSQDCISQAQHIIQDIQQDFVFLTISGAHLYGFSSHNSDLDIRGCHTPTIEEALRYSHQKDTYELMIEDSPHWNDEVDIVSHSLLKYIHLLTRRPNGYIIEQVLSPLVVVQQPMFEDIKRLAERTLCKELKYHFGGFFRNQTKLLQNKSNKEIKLTLYQARIICTSIHLARFGTIDSNLISANQKVNIFDQAKLQELVDLKMAGEKNNFPDQDIKQYWYDQIESKIQLMEDEFNSSRLPHFDPEAISQANKEFIHRHISLAVLN